MNDEILNKLRNEAGFGWGVAMGLYTHDVTEMWVEYDKHGEESWPSREIMEKFAELIVRECVQSIENTIQTNCDTDSEKMGCEFAITDLKKHFGVEE